LASVYGVLWVVLMVSPYDKETLYYTRDNRQV
jgi:hypothetical protein